MPLRVAIVGCGKIAEQHVEAVRRIRGASVVGVCDRERLMAQQLAERHGIQHVADDVPALMAEARPDVVHVTTPPASHLSIALRGLEAGCHVYVEKPFTLTASEARHLIEEARHRGLHITAGHNLQCTWESLAGRRLVREGFLGGPPVHIESYYTYQLKDRNYAAALLGDRQHWVRQLPGQLLHNIISHGIARIAEFLESDDPLVVAHGHLSPLMRSIGETTIIDELRVHVSDRRNMTASFVFSSQVSPAVNGWRAYGPVNSLVVDNLHHTVIRLKQHGYKSYVNYFLQPLHLAAEYARNARGNIARFVRADFHDDSGLKNCIEAFYESITGKGAPAVTHREVILTALIMDRIFEQLSAREMTTAAPHADRVTA